MSIQGVRISDKINRVVSVKLLDILEEIYKGPSLYWSIVYIDAIGNLGEGKLMVDFEEQVNDSERGLFIGWEDLKEVSQKFWDVWDITIIGSKNKEALKRYNADQEIYEKCEIVIEMIDSGYWEVFSHDEELIKRLAKKFMQTELLRSDYER